MKALEQHLNLGVSALLDRPAKMGDSGLDIASFSVNQAEIIERVPVGWDRPAEFLQFSKEPHIGHASMMPMEQAAVVSGFGVIGGNPQDFLQELLCPWRFAQIDQAYRLIVQIVRPYSGSSRHPGPPGAREPVAMSPF
jgi:hypothetical protein